MHSVGNQNMKFVVTATLSSIAYVAVSACPGKVETGFPKRTCANV